MVKNTPTVTTLTVQTMLSGTLAAIATPAVAPRIVAASHSHARRVDASADPAMTTYAVHATRRLCSSPQRFGDQARRHGRLSHLYRKSHRGRKGGCSRRRIRAGLRRSGGCARGFQQRRAARASRSPMLLPARLIGR